VVRFPTSLDLVDLSCAHAEREGSSNHAAMHMRPIRAPPDPLFLTVAAEVRPKNKGLISVEPVRLCSDEVKGLVGNGNHLALLAGRAEEPRAWMKRRELRLWPKTIFEPRCLRHRTEWQTATLGRYSVDVRVLSVFRDLRLSNTHKLRLDLKPALCFALSCVNSKTACALFLLRGARLVGGNSRRPEQLAVRGERVSVLVETLYQLWRQTLTYLLAHHAVPH
jgi:hypothetical protein